MATAQKLQHKQLQMCHGNGGVLSHRPVCVRPGVPRSQPWNLGGRQGAEGTEVADCRLPSPSFLSVPSPVPGFRNACDSEDTHAGPRPPCATRWRGFQEGTVASAEREHSPGVGPRVSHQAAGSHVQVGVTRPAPLAVHATLQPATETEHSQHQS